MDLLDAPPRPAPPEEISLPPLGGRVDGLGLVAKSHLQQVRARLQEWNAAGASGADVVQAFTAAVDRVVRYLFEAAVADFRRRSVQLGQKCAVLAQGGYGRGELNPFSDVDLLFLHSWKLNPFVESVAETVLYSLWDTGLTVGHAVRGVSECVRLAARDFTVKTSLLDARFLCGDADLHAELEASVRGEVVRTKPDLFFRQAQERTNERHRQYGGSVYLLEPHVKEGEGGLRDLHTALWVARVKFKATSLREIMQKGVLGEREVQSVLDSRDFLWRVRNTLHFLAGGHQDQLTFEYQERVAETLGYRDADERRAVERFLRDYYLHAANVDRFARTMLDRALARIDRYPRIGRFFSRTIRPGVRILNGEIVLEDPDVLSDPANVVSLFRESQRHGVALARRTKTRLCEEAPAVEAARGAPGVVEEFLEILRGRARIHQTLRDMHDADVLGAVLPEFGQLRCMVIRDFYHIYTVDEHTLRGVLALEQLAAGDFRQSCELLTQVRHEIENPEVLYLAMLLHDVGKGHGHGHSDRGARLAEAVARRMGFHEDDVRQVEILVRHHLLMSHVAQHRDLHDDRVIIDFAHHVANVEVLKKLYVMTFADMKAVAPNVWNNWRKLLLDECYLRTLELFEKGDFASEGREARAERVRSRLAETVAEESPALLPALGTALATMPSSYFLSTPEGSFEHHLELLREFRAGDAPVVTSIVHSPEREFSEFTVVTADRPGLFSRIAGVLAANGVNIVGAQITTSSDGVALDVFRLSHAEAHDRVLEEDRWHRVRQSLEGVLRGDVSVEALVEKSQQPTILTRPRLPVPTTVTYDLEGSEDYTLVEVSTRDEVGLLYAITNQLYRLGCLIHLAKISTVLHHVYDVFYVTDVDGRKIVDAGRLAAICESVRRRIDETARRTAA